MEKLGRYFLVIFLLGAGCFPETGVSEEKILPVPWSKQIRSYACGQNCFLMIMGYWETGLTKHRLFLYTGYNGTTSGQFQDIIENRYPAYTFQRIEKSIDEVIRQIRLGRPVMLDVKTTEVPYLRFSISASHNAVAVGYDTEKKVIYVRDPNTPYVQEFTLSRLEEGWAYPRAKIYTIYRKDGTVPPQKEPEDVKHFSKEGKPLGAERVYIPKPWYRPLFPSIYTLFHIGRDGPAAANLPEDLLYTFKLHGLLFGHLLLERSPWLFQEGEFFGLGGSFGFNFTTKEAVFGGSDGLSPGVFRFLETKTFRSRYFNTIKPVPDLTNPELVLEALLFTDLGLSYPGVSPAAEAPDLGSLYGGRVSLRRGLGQNWGYLGAGVSFTSTEVTICGEYDPFRIDVFGGDVTLGPLEGAFQYCTRPAFAAAGGTAVAGEADSGGTAAVKVAAYSLGINLSLPKITGGVLSVFNFFGFYRLFFRFNSTDFFIDVSEEGGTDWDTTVRRRSFRIEFPMALKIVELVYGGDLKFSVSDASWVLAEVTAGCRVLANQFLPYAQFQFGYTYTRKISSGSTVNSFHLGLYAGVQ